jgi:hypothetical protein
VGLEPALPVVHRCCKSVAWEFGTKSCDRGGKWCSGLKELAYCGGIACRDLRRESIPLPPRYVVG